MLNGRPFGYVNNDSFSVIAPTIITAAGKYITNVDVCHMVTVVYLLCTILCHKSSDALSLHLTSSVLPQLALEPLSESCSVAGIFFIISNSDSPGIKK
jgi:hypothetical protein